MSIIITDGRGEVGPANEWLFGTAAPGLALGRVGQPYLNTVTGETYLKERIGSQVQWTKVGVVSGPQGEPGDQGLPGVNAVPADEAVATYATTEGTATKAALSATIASQTAQLPASNGSDDTAIINARLAAGGVVRAKPGEDYIISAPLVIDSDTILDLRGATIRWKTGVSGDNMIRNRAATPQRTIASAAMTQGDTTLTAATGAFTSADVGRTVMVVGAGGGDGRGPLTAQIVSVTSSTEVELEQPAHVSVSGAVCRVANRDRNIYVYGGDWDRGGAVGDAGEKLHTILIRHVDGVGIHPTAMRSTVFGAKYAISLADVTDYSASVESLDTISDGIHVLGPAYRGTIPFAKGTTGDDQVAFTPCDYADYAVTAGDIIDCHVGDIICDGSPRALLVCQGNGYLTDGIVADSITGWTDRAAAVWIGEAGYNGGAIPAQVRGGRLGTVDLKYVKLDSPADLISIRNATARRISIRVVQPAGTGSGVVKVSPEPGAPEPVGRIEQLLLRDCEWESTGGVLVEGANVGRIVFERPIAKTPMFTQIGGTVDTVDVQRGSIDFTTDAAGSAAAPFFVQGGTLAHLRLTDTDVDTPVAKRTVFVTAAGSLARATIRGGKIVNAEQVVYDARTTGALALAFDGCNIASAKRLFQGDGVTVSANLGWPLVALSQEAFHNPSAPVVVQGALAHGSSGLTMISATTSIASRVNGDLPVDVSKITPLEGDRARNLSTSVAAGWYVGPVTWDGEKWVAIRGFAAKGAATLVGGTVVVAHSRIAANSRIRLYLETPIGTPGALLVSARTNGTSFTISSTSPSDASIVRWEVVAY